MKTIFSFLWPLSIIFALAFLALERGGAGFENPLSDHSVDQWLSLTRR